MEDNEWRLASHLHPLHIANYSVVLLKALDVTITRGLGQALDRLEMEAVNFDVVHAVVSDLCVRRSPLILPQVIDDTYEEPQGEAEEPKGEEALVSKEWLVKLGRY